MPNTMTLIASSTVGSGGAASIDFTSIANTYTDLLLKFSTRDTTTGSNWSGVRVEFNSSASNFSGRILYGTGSAAASQTNSGTPDGNVVGYSNSNAATSSTFGNGELYIPNYAGSNNKSISIDVVSETNATGALASLGASLWSITSAITSLSLKPYSGTFVQYSTAYLYGIVKS